jgi:glucose/arabinose dehydrogenase
MKRRLVALVAVLTATVLVATGCGAAVQAAAGGELVAIGAGLMGPSTMQAAVYATGLAKVSTLAVDAQGRLWAATADSTDRGADGVYLVPAAGARPVEVIPDLHTPLGLLWYQGSLYVASSGRVDAYSGFDGARFDAHRTVLTLAAGVGELNELALGPDGRMVMGISAPCDHCTPTEKWSAAIVSFRPDGSDLQVDVSGIRAPVGLAYFPGTSDLFVTMDQRDDLGAATPGDWLATVRSGQDWAFPGCYGQGGAPCAGVPRPVSVLDKHAGVSGVSIVTGQLGPSVGTSAIVAEWALGKLDQVTLSRTRSGYTGAVQPFVTGLKNPVPVLLTPGGALLVGDWTTGTLYRITRA